jgi:RNA polymerase sigma-70 factor (ECF subfamily)
VERGSASDAVLPLGGIVAAEAKLDAPVEVAPRANAPVSRPTLGERFLLRRLRRGDARAFAVLVARYQDRVFNLAARMLGDAAEAEDVTQEVFVSVHQSLARFRGECRLSTWIFRVAKNHALNRLKRAAVRDAAAVDAESAGDAREGQRPDALAIGREREAAVRRAIEMLPPDQRLLVVLRDMEGLSYEEVAEVADLPDGTVKSRLHRARMALMEILRGWGVTP